MGHEWRRHISHRLLDSCQLQRLCGRRDPRLRGGNLSGHDYDAQIGHLDPSLLPRESEARKPMAFATEGEAKQQRVEQQREQQRIRQSPVLRAHAVAVVRPWNPRNLVVLCGRCLDSAAGAGHDGKLRCASHQLTSPRVLALPNHVGTFANRTRSIVISTGVRWTPILTCPTEPSMHQATLRGPNSSQTWIDGSTKRHRISFDHPVGT